MARFSIPVGMIVGLSCSAFMFFAGSLNAQKTLELSPYFPAYPGSAWKYVDAKGNQTVDSVVDQYRLYAPNALFTKNDNCSQYLDRVFVPFLITDRFKFATRIRDINDGRSYLPVYGDGVPMRTPSVHGTIQCLMMSSLTSGGFIGTGSRCGNSCPGRTRIAKDTSISSGTATYDSVIIVQTDPIGNQSNVEWDFFAKNVGIVRTEKRLRYLVNGVATRPDSILDSSLLVSYHVEWNAKKSQIVTVDSLLPGLYIPSVPTQWGNWWERFYPNTTMQGDSLQVMRGINPDHVPAYKITKLGGDTIRSVTRNSSGLPTFYSVSGTAQKISDSTFYLPNANGVLELRAGAEASGDFHSAKEFRGRACIYAMPFITPSLLPSGATKLAANMPGPMIWRFADAVGENGALDWKSLEGEKDSVLITDKKGYYDFKANYDVNLHPCYLGAFSHVASAPFKVGGKAAPRPVFSEMPANLKQYDDGMVRWADVDGNGYPDLVVTGYGLWNSDPAQVPVTPHIYMNDKGKLTPVAAEFPVAHSNGAMEFGDFDNDGDVDMALSGCCDPNRPGIPFSGLYRNDKGVFTRTADSIFSGQQSSADWGDYDNDGDIDLLLSTSDETKRFTFIYRNDTGKFVDSQVRFPEGRSSLGQAKFCDFDNDGDLDVVNVAMVNDASYSGSGFFINDGNGAFTQGPSLKLSASGTSWADHDRDGDLDALIGSTLYRNDSGTMVATPIRFSNQYSSWIDVNGDGRMDVVSGNTFGLAQDLAFEGVTAPFSVFYPASSDWGDFDRDGDLDLAFPSRIFENRIAGSLEALPKTSAGARTGLGNASFVPTGMVASLSEGNLTMEWGPPAGWSRDSGPLTYALAVGTEPGKADVFSPMADLRTGVRLLASHGNAFMNHKWILKGLKAGTYYWAIQSVDQNLQGSPFTDFRKVEAGSGIKRPGKNTEAIRIIRLFAASGSIYLNFDIQKNTVAKIKVQDINGAELMPEMVKPVPAGNNTFILPSRFLNPRLVIVSVSAGGFRISRKLLLQ